MNYGLSFNLVKQHYKLLIYILSFTLLAPIYMKINLYIVDLKMLLLLHFSKLGISNKYRT